MKKIAFLLIVILTALVATIVYKPDKLKKEYESLNNKKTNNQKYIKVVIPKNSPLKYSNYEEILEVLDKTGIIYIGSAKKQISRDYLNQLIKAADNTGASKIYYLDTKNNKITKEYKKLLKKINKKEIYVPTLITVKRGKIKEIISEEKIISNKKYISNKSKKKEILENYMSAINNIINCSGNLKNQC